MTIWCLTGLVSVTRATDKLVANEPRKLALLVGCTRYPQNSALRELHGPANDVAIWSKMLTDSKGFGFALTNVIQLSSWPDDERHRPTYSNIVQGFESLISQAELNSQVVILLSGHGTQVPIPQSQADPLNPLNPEPDGLDEVFLAADVKSWNEFSGLENSVRDDQIGSWLDRLREKGAHVLIVFDCCHSGTMTRGGPNVREINRVANPAALGIPTQASTDSMKRAEGAVARARKAGEQVPIDRMVRVPASASAGSLVAFYAAQPFEEAPELLFPADAADMNENYFGLLSWSLVETLTLRQNALSYRELERLLSTRIRSTRGVRPPTPFAEGDLNRQVLGQALWPKGREIFLRKTKLGQLQIDAGLLQGVTVNSILAVYSPPQVSPLSSSPLGHVRVTVARPTDATAVFVRSENFPSASESDAVWKEDTAVEIDHVPDSCRCEILFQDFGDLRIPLFASDPTVQSELASLPKTIRQQFQIVSREEEASWVLRVVTPQEARDEYRVADITSPEVFLIQGSGQASLQIHESTAKRQDEGRIPGTKRKRFGRYPLTRTPELRDGLMRDLPKLFKWTNLWKIAAGVNATDGGENCGLQLELRTGGDPSLSLRPELQNRVLRDGQRVTFQLSHTGTDPLWISAFYVDANLGIQSLLQAGLQPGHTLRLAQATMTTENGSYGMEGIIVFALPQASSGVRPDFSMLEQEPLTVPEKLTRGPKRRPESGFDRLLNEAAFRSGARGLRRHLPTTPSIVTLSWLLVP